MRDYTVAAAPALAQTTPFEHGGIQRILGLAEDHGLTCASSERQVDGFLKEFDATDYVKYLVKSDLEQGLKTYMYKQLDDGRYYLDPDA